MPALKRDEDAAVEIGVIPVDSQPLAPVDTPAAVAEPAGAGNLLDIDLLLETPAPVAAPEVIGTAPTGPAPVVSTEQALFDIFSIGDPMQPALAEPVAAPPIMNLFSSEPEPSQDLEFEDFHGASSNLELTVYDDENFTVAFSCSKPDLDNPQITSIDMTSSNKTLFTITNFNLQAAVPKHLKLQLAHASGTTMTQGGKITQNLKITNSMQGEKAILLKLKIDFSNKDGENMTKMATVNTIPNDY